jgi:hypothetical protein
VRYLTPSGSREILDFARKAAASFLENPKLETFTDGEIEGGALFGVRWGADRPAAHAVLVLRIDEGFEPIIVGDLDHDRQSAEKAEARPAPLLPALGSVWSRKTEPWRFLEVVAVSPGVITLSSDDKSGSLYHATQWPGDLVQRDLAFLEREAKCPAP